MCRYITRPALADERVQINSAGQVVPKPKTAWRDSTIHIVMPTLPTTSTGTTQVVLIQVWTGSRRMKCTLTATMESIIFMAYPAG